MRRSAAALLLTLSACAADPEPTVDPSDVGAGDAAPDAAVPPEPDAAPDLAPDADPQGPGCRVDADCADGWRCLVEAGVCADRARWGGEPPPEVVGLEGDAVLLDCAAGLNTAQLSGCRWRVPGAWPEPVAASQAPAVFEDQGPYAGELEVIGLDGGVSRVPFAIQIADRQPVPRLRVAGPVHEGQAAVVYAGAEGHPSDPLAEMEWATPPSVVSADGLRGEFVFDDGAEAVCLRARDEDSEVVECVPVVVEDATPQVEVEGPFRVDVGEALVLEGTARAGAPTDLIQGFRWDLGDGAQADGAQVEHAWAAPGVYRVRLAVRDEDSVAHADTVVAVGELGPRAVCGVDLRMPNLGDPRAQDDYARRLVEDVTPLVGALVNDAQLPPAAAAAVRALAGELAERPNCRLGDCAPWLVTLARLVEAHAALEGAGEAWAADARCLAELVKFIGPMTAAQLDFACGGGPVARHPLEWLRPQLVCAAFDAYNGCAQRFDFAQVAWPQACAPVGLPCGPGCPNACQPLCLDGDPCEPACWPARCDDGVRDGAETDRDCGGGCGPCAEGQGCHVDADCQDGLRCGVDARCLP